MTLRLPLIAICTFFFVKASAQDYYNYRKITDPFHFINLPVLDDMKKQYIVDNHISSVATKRYGFKKNGKRKRYYYGSTFTFNELGQITKVKGRNHKKDIGYSEYTYYKNGKLATHAYYNRKGKLEKYHKQHFEGVERAYIQLDTDLDTVLYVVKGLKKGNNIATDYFYKKGKLKYRWINEYDVDDKLQQVTIYKGNGKVKYIWDYRCIEEGAEILKHKDTTTICTSVTENEDGTTTYVYQNVNEKGELVKCINRMNKSGKLEHYRRLKGVEEVVAYEYDIEYDDDDSTITNTLSKYYRKGTLRSVTDKTFDADHYFVSHVTTRFKKGEIVSESIRQYEYGQNGLPSRYTRENKVKKSKGVTEFNFDINSGPGTESFDLASSQCDIYH